MISPAATESVPLKEVGFVREEPLASEMTPLARTASVAVSRRVKSLLRPVVGCANQIDPEKATLPADGLTHAKFAGPSEGLRSGVPAAWRRTQTGGLCREAPSTSSSSKPGTVIRRPNAIYAAHPHQSAAPARYTKTVTAA
jgi:hypothetical protein